MDFILDNPWFLWVILSTIGMIVMHHEIEYAYVLGCEEEKDIRELIQEIVEDYYVHPDEYLSPEEVDDGTLDQEEKKEEKEEKED